MYLYKYDVFFPTTPINKKETEKVQQSLFLLQ